MIGRQPQRSGHVHLMRYDGNEAVTAFLRPMQVPLRHRTQSTPLLVNCLSKLITKDQWHLHFSCSLNKSL